ncbi:MAG: hypothetical protein QG563_261, partial [Patescibacteria group bacterium]|nr:hypothetical protein [Patescibacteria group bacterium]
ALPICVQVIEMAIERSPFLTILYFHVLLKKVKEITIEDEYMGSVHCPVTLTLGI